MSDKKYVKVSAEEIMRGLEDHPGIQSDRRKRQANVEAGRELCERCDGTGNELYAMYSRCADCDGRGYPLPEEVN